MTQCSLSWISCDKSESSYEKRLHRYQLDLKQLGMSFRRQSVGWRMDGSKLASPCDYCRTVCRKNLRRGRQQRRTAGFMLRCVHTAYTSPNTII
jgi:hypothetical protein